MVLLDSHSVARYCSKKKISETGRIMATAFLLRQAESELSVVWVEYFARPTRVENIVDVKKELPTLGITARKGALLGIIPVGNARGQVQSELNVSIWFRHTPSKKSKAHSTIEGMACDAQEEIAQVLAEIANREVYPAVF